MSPAEKKARARIKKLSTPQIIDQFELTEAVNDKYIPIVRGWLMDELESRNSEAFDKWLESGEDSPRIFY